MKTIFIKCCVFVLLTSALFFFGCDDDSSTGPDGAGALTISGTVIGVDANAITHVGLFQQGGDTEKVVDMEKDNARPSTITAVNDTSWSLSMPGDPEDWDMFLALGWNDADGDGMYDPESGEMSGTAFRVNDEFSTPRFWYFENEEMGHVAGWNVQIHFDSYENLFDFLDVWTIVAGAVIDDISIIGNWHSSPPYNDFNQANIMRVTNDELIFDWTDEEMGDVYADVVEYSNDESLAILLITEHPTRPEQVGKYLKITWTFLVGQPLDMDVYALHETRDGAYNETEAVWGTWRYVKDLSF